MVRWKIYTSTFSLSQDGHRRLHWHGIMTVPPTSPSTGVDRQSLDSTKRAHLCDPFLGNSPTSEDTQQGERLPPPSSRGDPSCKSCTTPEEVPYRFNKMSRRYLYGEILQVNESVHAPIDPLFASVARAKAEFPTQVIPRGRGKGPRPAVVLVARPIQLEIEETYTMLMTTYSNTYNLAELPSVLQLFCMPVSPHCEIQAGVEHLHTIPEWQKEHVWLLALPFNSPGEVFGRWRWQDEHGKRCGELSFYVDEKALFELAEIQGRKWDEWSKKSLDEEGYLEACYAVISATSIYLMVLVIIGILPLRAVLVTGLRVGLRPGIWDCGPAHPRREACNTY